MKLFLISVCFATILLARTGTGSKDKGDNDDESDKHGVREPSRCEVCRILAFELNEQLIKTNKKETIRLGHVLDGENRRTVKTLDYRKTEIRLIEVMEKVCGDIEKYNIHAEHSRGVMRYRKHMSETMRTLNGLRLKGVKVELGIPEDLWNATSAETAKLKRQCDKLLEEAEDLIEDWYMGDDDEKPDLLDHLCRGGLLKGSDTGCLDEHPDWDPNKQPVEEQSEKKKLKKKKSEL